MSSIIDAIKTGDLSTVQKIITTTPELANETTPEGLSILLLAAYYGQMPIAQLIASKKSNLDIFEATAIGELNELKTHLHQQPDLLNAHSIDGFTPLGLAAFFGQVKLVQFLIKQGADVNIASNNNFKVTPLHSATAKKQYDIAQLLIENGANVNAQQMSGVTALHAAAHNGDVPLVKLLVKNGANIHAKMKEGQTPLIMAKEKKFIEIIEILSAK